MRHRIGLTLEHIRPALWTVQYREHIALPSQWHLSTRELCPSYERLPGVRHGSQDSPHRSNPLKLVGRFGDHMIVGL